MEPSSFALWLDSALGGFDTAILRAVHGIQQSPADVVLWPLSKLLALLGKWGVAPILLGVGLLCKRRTRRCGIGVLLALAFGALCTNVILKPLVARPRPYDQVGSELYQWWVEAGGSTESDLSFPSGHVTAAMAAMTAIFFLGGSARQTWPVFLFAGAMAFSRMYLMVHYPTDVLAGLLVGLGAGILATWLVRHHLPLHLFRIADDGADL